MDTKTTDRCWFFVLQALPASNTFGRRSIGDDLGTISWVWMTSYSSIEADDNDLGFHCCQFAMIAGVVTVGHEILRLPASTSGLFDITRE